MAVERRQLLMGGGAGLALVLAMWLMWPAAPQTTTPQSARTARSARTTAADAPQPVEPLKLDALTATRDEPGEAPRNPFQFQAKPAPPPPRIAAPPMTEAPRPTMPVQTGPPPLPPIPLKLIGLLERANGVKWAVLSDGKSAPMYGKDGDIIDGRFTIVKIGTESVEMTYADGRGRQVLRLTGQ